RQNKAKSLTKVTSLINPIIVSTVCELCVAVAMIYQTQQRSRERVEGTAGTRAGKKVG
uniref:Uncharacterized protein n=1 Tax=Loxodonta africana TaxID=9785 RepID=G3U5P4_LOXAF